MGEKQQHKYKYRHTDHITNFRYFLKKTDGQIVRWMDRLMYE